MISLKKAALSSCFLFFMDLDEEQVGSAFKNPF